MRNAEKARAKQIKRLERLHEEALRGETKAILRGDPVEIAGYGSLVHDLERELAAVGRWF